ncbi:uncharacterized protein H6S33_011062 [Morchella sextelata]|uniref:uncharacterized protein n=1 Tax=Morchella sextelata TaxID=1174677 RepID=UPI001D03FFB7|nr:uncharacterized protein H6S33_011062 [Morchella sextelata]KAH0611797.1 hypothetical protein H6S33_011062 [Morchella sextelata]
MGQGTVECLDQARLLQRREHEHATIIDVGIEMLAILLQILLQLWNMPQTEWSPDPQQKMSTPLFPQYPSSSAWTGIVMFD